MGEDDWIDGYWGDDGSLNYSGNINTGGYDYGGGGGYEAPAYQDYSGPTGYGQGAVSRNGGAWDPIEATPSYTSSGQGFMAPASGFSSGYTGPTQYRSSSSDPSWAAHQSWASGPSIAPQNYAAPRGGSGGGGSPGARSVSQQSPQLISMGTPERTLYDRYKSMLMQPDQLQQDPAYQFMYNQGLQALNRSLAAKRMQFSGKAMNDTMAYGAGQAATGMKSIMPLYQAGAGEELNRFLGPSGLLPRYAASNNAAIGGADRMVSNADDRAMYAGMLSQPSYGGGGGMDVGAGIGYGGRSSGYTPTPQYAAAPQNLMPRPMNYAANPGIPELMDDFYG